MCEPLVFYLLHIHEYMFVSLESRPDLFRSHFLLVEKEKKTRTPIERDNFPEIALFLTEIALSLESDRIKMVDRFFLCCIKYSRTSDVHQAE